MEGVCKGILLAGAVAYLFYNSAVVIPFLVPLILLYLYYWNRERLKLKQEEFLLEFKESMLTLNSALSVGYSVENALREVVKDLSLLYGRESRIMQEYIYIVHELDINVAVEVCLEAFAERVDAEDVKNFVTVFITAKRVGGDSIAIIKNSIQIICDKIEVKREIQTLMSAKVFEFKVMSAIPFGIIFYMRISFPEFMGSLYGNWIGRVVMTVCLVLYLAAYYMGTRIVDIEV